MGYNNNSQEKRKRLQTFTFPNSNNNIIYSDSPKVPIALRVSPDVYLLYHSLKRREKKEVRDIIEQVIASYAKQVQNKVENHNIIINMNVLQAHPDVVKTLDPLLKDKLERLTIENRELKESAKFWKQEAKKYGSQLKVLQKENRQLKERIQELETINMRLKEKVSRLEAQNDKLYKQLRQLRGDS